MERDEYGDEFLDHTDRIAEDRLEDLDHDTYLEHADDARDADRGK